MDIKLTIVLQDRGNIYLKINVQKPWAGSEIYIWKIESTVNTLFLHFFQQKTDLQILVSDQVAAFKFENKVKMSLNPLFVKAQSFQKGKMSQ